MKEEFIHIGEFVLKKNDIIYAQKKNNSIEISIKQGEKSQLFIVNYDNPYSCDDALDRLSSDVDAITDDHWKHSLVRQMFFTREYARKAKDECESIKKELNLLRKELRKNRLNVKEQS